MKPDESLFIFKPLISIKFPLDKIKQHIQQQVQY